MESRSYPFSWEPGWSFSRMNVLRTCLRMYWYEYYGKRFAPERQRNRIVQLQQLSRVPFELGNAVHQTVAEVLKHMQIKGVLQPMDEAADAAVNKFEILVRNKPLIEKRLGIRLTGEERDKIHNQIRTSVTTFYSSKWLTMIQEMPRRSWNEWLVDPEGYGEFRLDGKKAYAKPDFVFRYRDDRHYLVEWKTGKPNRDQNMVQVQGYIFYANDILGIDLEGLVGVVQYLTYPSEQPIVVEGRLVNPIEMKNKILSEIRLIESKCENLTDNIPKPLGQFPKTDDEGICELCKYVEICQPGLFQKIKNENMGKVGGP
jgi:CRISPR/Cas system-associated exonuclease Cas4 (RecB family)